MKNKSFNFVRIFSLNLLFMLLLNIGHAENFKEFVNNTTDNVLSTAANLLIVAGFVVFSYGVLIFIYGRLSGKGTMSDLEKGKKFMLWGLVALFVMVSAWGIVQMTQGLLNIKSSNIKITPISSTNTDPSNINPTQDNRNPSNDTGLFD